MKRYRMTSGTASPQSNRNGSVIAADDDVEQCSLVSDRYTLKSQRRRRNIKWLIKFSPKQQLVNRTLAFNFVGAILALFVVHESGYYFVLNSLRLPGSPYFGQSSSTQQSHQRTNSTVTQKNMALISLHRGVKFAGYLGTWLDGNKLQYANRHGYLYFNQDDFWKCYSQLANLSPWQSVYRRRVMFDKLRYILYILQQYPNIHYVLWMDGDAIIANADITVEARIDEFEQVKSNVLLVWASDGQPNAGVLLIRNCVETRALLVQSLRDDNSSSTVQHTWLDETFTDQSFLTRAVNENSTYRNGQLLLPESNSRRLQSRVRGPSWRLYRPGDWILHLANHNRLELLFSLFQHFRSV